MHESKGVWEHVAGGASRAKCSGFIRYDYYAPQCMYAIDHQQSLWCWSRVMENEDEIVQKPSYTAVENASDWRVP